ncbi:methyl-accepting chemotaxis protein [Rhizobium sp. C4]|uniref:methyl-accepting chemotaxis protein n=1 Tax=Rhizobium sp. C4 TaxID=1349800 RepID=UPI001E5D79D7|nr:HAMP domain-containing methyl-accepting chemotaxis protein [Rhizobium sp. C4]MCD2175251.1 methyl-accepting chemotaxis protein [Rhizobium sp. C4]
MTRPKLSVHRPSIRTGLIAAIGSLAVVSGVIAAGAVMSMKSMDQRFELLASTAMAGISMSKDIDLAAVKLREAYGQHLLAADKPAKAEVEKTITAINDNLAVTLKAYAEVLGESGDKAALAELDKQLTAYNKMGKTLLFYSTQGKDQNARMYLGSMSSIGNTLSKITGDIVTAGNKSALKSGDEARAATARMILIAEILAGFAAAVALVAGIFVVRGIAMPIGRITKSMRDLAAGDTASTIPFAGRGDEIGAMAGAVEVFRQAAITNKELEREAEEARHRADAERREAERQAEANAAERLRIATSGLASALERLAHGDLGFQIEEAFSADFEQLRHDFNKSVRQLSETLSEISNAVGAVENGSHEIASGANDLSRRTEQQAASLEETAAALDEITVNVSNSARRTEEARTIAGRANQSALTSSKVVADAEDAMRRIEESSRQISNIIGVIDEIAFQTNLLALNAGVEAARAGDAGKGFAVVAMEVRELAGRSANAAKEIKALIKNSATEVDAGVKLVRNTGSALNEIGGFIVEINGHMEAIAQSAKEQSTGLAEVNGAVNQMDQTTQQNAAMVEESTAASAALAGEAQTLRALISKFSFGDMPASATPSAMLRQTAAAMAAPARSTAPRAAAAPVRVARAGSSAAPAAAQGWEEF